ncbi:hypothetical protein Bpfe_027093 [Biomphalaria pfeifferi]|uniref:Uncharacterized protein n=1 Tax=Biomphalaria pfeifferi TaxID=112525 RepID=A0AAD8AVX6_BIOPF|nr:hypothetical protein Bpfe_027093 [Biomphalaria pfeifferi]
MLARMSSATTYVCYNVCYNIAIYTIVCYKVVWIVTCYDVHLLKCLPECRLLQRTSAKMLARMSSATMHVCHDVVCHDVVCHDVVC